MSLGGPFLLHWHHPLCQAMDTAGYLDTPSGYVVIGTSLEFSMRHLKLAYRDNNRTPVIFCIHEMVKRFYDLDVEVVQIQGTKAYEAALFDGSCDVIIEHLEYLFAGANDRLPVTLFCAPSISRGLELVVDPRVRHLEEWNGKTMAVRSSGGPHAVTLWIKKMGLESTVRTVIVKDSEVGRWGQWKKVVSGAKGARRAGYRSSRAFCPGLSLQVAQQ